MIKHELIHWQQYQREGLIPFIFNYGFEAIKNGYDANKYEIEARVKSGENNYAVYNYTNAVRTGQAKSVYNKNFRK